MEFDPSGPGIAGNNIFGLPYTPDNARIVLVPVPWDVTVSYSDGTSRGPGAIFDASYQVDLYDPFLENAWKTGIAMEKEDRKLVAANRLGRQKARKYIDFVSKGGSVSSTSTKARAMKKLLTSLNGECRKMNDLVRRKSTRILDQGRIPAVVGGEHSVPLGLIEALSEKHGKFGILHIDAHADLRAGYEGFEFSHASIMYNAIKNENVSRLVQVGIRDYCQEELELIRGSNGRIRTWFDRDLKRAAFEGRNWKSLAEEIAIELPEKVYISFDIDGLDSKYCPGTGTPVPGGLEFEEALFLLETISQKSTIIGFDLCEVAPRKGTSKDEWDANVGARLLYRLCNMTARSNGIVP